MRMLRITPSGEAALFGQRLPMDPSTITDDPASTDLYVASGCGVCRTFSSSIAVFKVEAWSGNVLVDGRSYATRSETGPADITEWVSVSQPVEAEDVLEIDPSRRGTYRLASGPCSSLVAGVVSTKPGDVLADSRTRSGAALLALAGIVPVRVTDEDGPIRPGDLLVRALTSGHAMHWADLDPCPCTLVGKALEPILRDRGGTLVLLTPH